MSLLVSLVGAINNFNQRITHILNGHKNSLVSNLPWSYLSAYIIGYEAQVRQKIVSSVGPESLKRVFRTSEPAEEISIYRLPNSFIRAMIFDQSFYKSNLAWICNTAQQIRNNVGDKNQV